MATTYKPKRIIYYNRGKGKNSKLNQAWWASKTDDICHDVFGVTAELLRHQMPRMQRLHRSELMYTGNPIESPAGTPAGVREFSKTPKPVGRLTLNVIKSACDTVTSKIAQERPRTHFITTQGDWSQQRRARLLTQFVDGLFTDQKIYEVGQQVFLDSTVFGTGFAKIYREEAKLCVERVFPAELFVDENEALYGKPRSLHQRRFVSRETLIACYPDKATEIAAAPALDYTATGVPEWSSDTVMVLESWHLPSGDDADDGRHTICVPQYTLLDEKYEHDDFPFVGLRWTPALKGWWGLSVVDELDSIQLEINKLLWMIQRSQHLIAVPRILLPSSAKISAETINNQIAEILKYTGGQPPTFIAPQAISNEIYAHLDRLLQQAYGIVGISQLSAQSIKPAGLNSGIAQRVYQDIESDRFQLQAQRYETFYLDVSKWIVKLARELYEAKTNLTVKIRGKKFIDTIKWSEVDLDDDSFVIEAQTENRLPKTPAGKIQTAQELFQAGIIDKEAFLDILRMPDADKLFSLELATRENIKWQIEKMLDDGEYQTPDTFMDIQAAHRLALQAYNDARQNGAPEDRLDLLRRYIENCQELLGAAQQAAQPAPSALGQPPVPPTSDLMPLTTAQPPV